MTFEYPTHGDPLGETQRGQGHRTRVDVRVDSGRDATALVEVKFTESEFGACSAGHDDENPDAAFCLQPGWTVDRAASHRYLGKVKQRSYFTLLPQSPVAVAALEEAGALGCPLRQGRYQLVRNLLIAGETKKQGKDVTFAVLAPGPKLNKQLHSSSSLHGAADLGSFLSGLVKDGAVRTQFIDFEKVLGEALTR